ncbi:ATP-binding cassette domain-containing protein [Devosia sp. SD17-2]|uniref:ATP-binding cassette domain-containing protein n=1 Tax=Devosia sp. SD17-2 TaxID=2976459 RepID=UPI0023D8BEE8|nr:ATP-binding cassette domain-containing protein [Devosia sp. SD17-2]WEJ34789.1 ATP-binding cassette domain-containing protein [Devosia sp. SD17-2]
MTPDTSTKIALSVDNLVVRFKRPRASDVQAVSDVSISLPEQSTLALIGESGSGKSTLAPSRLRTGASYLRHCSGRRR